MEANPQLELAIMEFERQIRLGERALKIKLVAAERELITNYITDLRNSVKLFNDYQKQGRLKRAVYVAKITKNIISLKNKYKSHGADLERISAKGVN